MVRIWETTHALLMALKARENVATQGELDLAVKLWATLTPEDRITWRATAEQFREPVPPAPPTAPPGLDVRMPDHRVYLRWTQPWEQYHDMGTL